MMIDDIKMKLYQLIDVSDYIDELSSKLCRDYDYYSNLLILACVEEKYLMIQLMVDLDDYLNLNESRWGLFRKKTRISMTHYNWDYEFRLPRLDEYSREYVELKCVFDELHRETRDFNNYISSGNTHNTIFSLRCGHKYFNTDDYLKSKNVKITYTI